MAAISAVKVYCEVGAAFRFSSNRQPQKRCAEAGGPYSDIALATQQLLC
jgi:hypothetical protein